MDEATEAVLEHFPTSCERGAGRAGNLSGGEQQMLTLGMAFIAKPRLLMIDELSLGLAPIVVDRLLEIVEAIRARGTTIILVEQSVNVALTLAETAYFMEKGQIRFHGPTRELLDRPEILRSVFLEGAESMSADARGAEPDAVRVPAVAAPGEPRPNGERGGDRAGGRAADPLLRRGAGRQRRVVLAGPGRHPRRHRPQRRGQDHAVRRHLRLHAADGGACCSRAPTSSAG